MVENLNNQKFLVVLGLGMSVVTRSPSHCGRSRLGHSTRELTGGCFREEILSSVEENLYIDESLTGRGILCI